MNQFMALLKREYWEWKRVIFWTLGVYSFLLLLTLIPMNRMSNHFESWAENEQVWDDDEISFNMEYDDEEITEHDLEEIKIIMKSKGLDITRDDGDYIDSLFVKGKLTAKEKLAQSPLTVIKPYSYGIFAGFSMIQFFVLFIGLFYFSDSLFKERSNYSTLYFRSLPLNDHWVLFAKLKAGSGGIIGLTIAMLTILLVYSQIAIMTLSGDIWEIISEPLSQINMMDLFFDLILYQAVALIWMSPLILFLMFVSATVKNRPLIVGVGMPILVSITLTVIYGENAFVTQIGDIFGAIAEMAVEQNLISHGTVVSEAGVDLFDSFFGDLFSVRTFGSLIVSGLFYIATWKMYGKNISTN